MEVIPMPDERSSDPAVKRSAFSSVAEAAGGVDADVIVVGAGLAGLVAAAMAARAGARVVLLERSSEAGGRAATHTSGDFRFNLGPHALYDGGPAARTLAELGVVYSGRRPPVSGGLALRGGRLHGLPGGFVSLLTTDLLSLAGKLELGRVLGGLARVDARNLRGQTLERWLGDTFHDAVVRDLMEALMRLTSYANDPARACAAAHLAQLQAGLSRGVQYVDDGWATLVTGLRLAAEGAGVSLRCNWRAKRVRSAGGLVEVEDGDGRVVRARAVVLALPPTVAASMLDGAARERVDAWARACVPVRAACLDVGLRRLPDPRRLFVVGLDQSLYFSVHSASARLAPQGAATMNVAKYLRRDRQGEQREEDPKEVEAELEAFCDLVQPGWRREVVERRYLPSMTVAGDLVAAGRPRAGCDVPGEPWLLLAGDWVSGPGVEGETAMLADAAVASGREAGLLAAGRIRGSDAAQGPPATRRAVA